MLAMRLSVVIIPFPGTIHSPEHLRLQFHIRVHIISLGQTRTRIYDIC